MAKRITEYDNIEMKNNTSRFWLGFLIGVISTLLIIYIFRIYFCALLLWLIFGV